MKRYDIDFGCYAESSKLQKREDDVIANDSGEWVEYDEAAEELSKLREQLAAAEAKLKAASELGLPIKYEVDGWYKQQNGEWVQFVGVHAAGTDYETMYDSNGIHRYTSRDFGRVTGTNHDYSEEINTPPIYAAPIPPVDVQELQRELAKKTRVIKCRNDDLRDQQNRIAELERKLAEQQVQSCRYERLRILGCAPYGSIQLENGLVLRFQNLDAFIDSDLAQVKSRGDFRDGEREELNTLLAQAMEEGFTDGSANAGFAHALDCNKAFNSGYANGVKDGREDGRKEAIPDRMMKELKQMRKSLISWRTQRYPDRDQSVVVDKDYPTIAMLVSAPTPGEKE